MEPLSHNKLWFKRKRWGFGWTPVSWEGWVALLLYVGILTKIFILMDMKSHSGSGTLINFAVPFIALTVILIAICYKKGESPKWTWGKEKN